MSRTLNVVRMQLVNRMTFVGIPLIILFSTFALTLVIFTLIPPGGAKWGGGMQAPLWYLFAMGIQALALTFPFSQAMSITRREFFAGTMITGLGSVLGLTVITTIGGFIEDATNGWGMNGSFFRVFPELWAQSPALSALSFFTVGALLFVFGFLFALIYRRWGTAATVGTGIGIGVFFVVAALLITKLEAWGPIVSFFGAIGTLGTLVMLLIITAVLAGIEFILLRRATP